MKTQNITLSLPAGMIKRLKIVAAERGTSISGLLTEQLRDFLQRESAYARARRRSLAELEQGWQLGTNGRASWQRAALHER